MDVVDILISIVVVTILVTIILAVVTYVAYKLRLSREPVRKEDDPTGLRYFVRYDPPSVLTGQVDATDPAAHDTAGMS